MRAIAQIRASGRVPLLTGGTGLYFRALDRGLTVLPPASPPVRADIETEAACAGWPAMHARLAGIDPRSARRIHPNDPQRIERALEVHALTGRPMSELLARGRQGGLVGPVSRIVIEPSDRDALHRDIAARFMRMLDAGLLDEVHTLRRCWRLTERSASMRLVGYRQAWAHLEGQWLARGDDCAGDCRDASARAAPAHMAALGTQGASHRLSCERRGGTRGQVRCFIGRRRMRSIARACLIAGNSRQRPGTSVESPDSMLDPPK